MKPEADDILRLCVMRLATSIAPLVGPDIFALGQIGLVSSMMNLAAQEYERGADIRAKENADIRKLFAKLASQVREPSLKAKLEKAARKKDASLLISALNSANYDLRRLLSEAQAHIEQLPGLRARQAERHIWSTLRKLADRRLIKFGTP